jgi:hypothetical protein
MTNHVPTSEQSQQSRQVLFAVMFVRRPSKASALNMFVWQVSNRGPLRRGCVPLLSAGVRFPFIMAHRSTESSVWLLGMARAPSEPGMAALLSIELG